MKISFFIKIILNIVFYLIYVFSITIIISFSLPLIFNIFIENGSDLSGIIQSVIVLLVLFTTIIYRKYFYISLDSYDSSLVKEDDTIIHPNKRYSKSKPKISENKIDESVEVYKNELDILVAKEK